jgi:hypothetical protein
MAPAQTFRGFREPQEVQRLVAEFVRAVCGGVSFAAALVILIFRRESFVTEPLLG